MENYNEYLKVGDQIKLNKIVNELEEVMLLNELQMDKYDNDTCLKKVIELNNIFYQLLDLKNETIAHNNYELYSECESYCITLQSQMAQLRSKYMNV